MPDLDIRTLGPADHPAVAILWHDAWHDAHAQLCPTEIVRHRSPASFAQRLPGFAADAYVVTDEDGPLAFAALAGAEIDQFFLARRARGTGLAARLMDAMEAVLVDRGDVVAVLECAVGNERARRFYLSRGFVETGVEVRPMWMPDGASAAFPMHRLAKRLDR